MNEMEFKPAWWLPGAHLQTMWPTLCRRPIKNLALQRERIELADGDFIDLDWVGARFQGKPIVLLLHGLEGSIESLYAQGMLQAIYQEGWCGVLIHFRSCSGELNRLPRLYHSGDTRDVATIVELLQQREPNSKLAAVGFSLGGNVLLKWLGETTEGNPLTVAIAVSVPFELQKVALRIQQGFSQIYQWHLLKSLRSKFFKKLKYQSLSIRMPAPKDFHTLYEFDEYVTAPLHGFVDARDYYEKSSSRQYLRNICVPTLLLHAKDDPFMTTEVIPEAHELSDHITLEVTEHGGHVGFVSGSAPWRAEYWLEKRTPAFLREYL